MTAAPDDPPAAHNAPPQTLDYFAAHAPDAPAPAGLAIGWFILALGWIPFICGIVNAQATVRSGVEEIITAHRNAAVLFSGIGLVTILASAALFLRARDWFGFGIAFASLVIASGLAGCLIGPSRWG